MTERVELSRPLTPAEERAVALMSQGWSQGLNCQHLGEILGISERTVRAHIKNAGAKIPGDLPLQHRVVNWYRGGATWTFPPEVD